MRLVLILALSLALAPAAPRAEPPAAAIEAVIADQIGDFQRDDLAGAFAHAAPSIQEKFGGPERFGRMVRQGYPMIWRPSRWETRELTQTRRGWVQTMLFVDAEGRHFEADYLMERRNGTWRIAGVRLRKLPGVAS